MNKLMKFNPIFWFFLVIEWFSKKAIDPVLDAVNEFYKAREKEECPKP